MTKNGGRPRRARPRRPAYPTPQGAATGAPAAAKVAPDPATGFSSFGAAGGRRAESSLAGPARAAWPATGNAAVTPGFARAAGGRRGPRPAPGAGWRGGRGAGRAAICPRLASQAAGSPSFRGFRGAGPSRAARFRRASFAPPLGAGWPRKPGCCPPRCG